MASPILAPQFFLRYSLSSSYLTPLFLLRGIRGRWRKPWGLPPSKEHSEIRGWQRVRFRNLKKKKICLWRGDEKLGVFTIPQVVNQFLGPGKALSWRPRAGVDYEELEHTALPIIMDYEVISIAGSDDPDIQPDPVTEVSIRMDQVHTVSFRPEQGLTSEIHREHFKPSTPRAELAAAYRLFEHPEDGALYPVQFKILPPAPGVKYPSTDWAKTHRHDLHPTVLKAALPEGVEFKLKPHQSNIGEGRIMWYFKAKHYDPTLLRKNRGQDIEPMQEPEISEIDSHFDEDGWLCPPAEDAGQSTLPEEAAEDAA
jgi:hypothetical protein